MSEDKNPPCKVGDLIYKVAIDGAVIEFKVLSIERGGTCLKARDTYRKNVFLFPVAQFGKTLFVNKEDALKIGAAKRIRFSDSLNAD